MKIRRRHEFIKPIIGVFSEEEAAYSLVCLLMWLLPTIVILGAIVDFALFYVYQTKLHTWKGLFIGPEPEQVTNAEDDVSFVC